MFVARKRRLTSQILPNPLHVHDRSQNGKLFEVELEVSDLK